MRRYKPISDTDRAAILRLSEAGLSNRAIGRAVNRAHQVVRRITRGPYPADYVKKDSTLGVQPQGAVEGTSDAAPAP
jgi:IS30 family transposase